MKKKKRLIITLLITGTVFIGLGFTVIFFSKKNIQQRRIKSILGDKGALFSYTGQDKFCGIGLPPQLSNFLLKVKIQKLSGIVAINEPIEDEDLKVLKGYKGINDITLENSKITDKGIAFLNSIPNLKSLNVNKCNVTDEAVDEICKIKTLEALSIEQTNITKKGLIRIQKALPQCIILWKKSD